MSRTPRSSATTGAAGWPGRCRASSRGSPGPWPRSACRTRPGCGRPRRRSAAQRRALRWLGPQQVPFWPERYLTNPAYVARVLRAWSGPGWPSEEEVDAVRRGAADPVRGALGGGVLPVAGALAAAPGRPPLPGRHRGADRASRSCRSTAPRDGLVLPGRRPGARRTSSAAYRFELVHGAGHFLPEERPAEVSELLAELAARPPLSRRRARSRAVAAVERSSRCSGSGHGLGERGRVRLPPRPRRSCLARPAGLRPLSVVAATSTVTARKIAAARMARSAPTTNACWASSAARRARQRVAQRGRGCRCRTP